MRKKKLERKRPKPRPVHPKRRIRSKKSKAKSPKKHTQLPVAEPTATELAKAEGTARGARVRLNPAERELLVAAVLATLPMQLQKAYKESKWWNVDYQLRAKFKVQRSLIGRLLNPQRGHPSSYGSYSSY